MLLHPAGTPGAGQPYSYFYSVRVAGERLAIVNGGDILIREAGADGVLGNSDDTEVSLGVFWPQLGEFDLAGNYVVYLDAGGEGGKQVYLVDLAAGRARQALTGHYSVKQHLAVEPSGRVYWKDSAFLNDAIFVRTP
jgi:hypothetical protein